MYDVFEFISWALTHVTVSSVPKDAILPIPRKECGKEPWHYLFGTVKSRTTKAKIEERWTNYYKKAGWTREKYDVATEGFAADDIATDCQGILDAWLTYEKDDKTDINSAMNYNLWCTDKGLIKDIDRKYVIGEAVFRANAAGRIVHVGWICGFQGEEPLVVEARSLSYGTVVSVLSKRNFTHRGLMTNKFEYEKEAEKMIKFENKSPMLRGEAYLSMQKTLNLAGYLDGSGNKLVEDGKWGKNSQHAFESMLKENAADEKMTIKIDINGETVYEKE